MIMEEYYRGINYRYWLHRALDSAAPYRVVAFIMLNPSTATVTTDDPTIRRCKNYAKSWGYRELIVLNLFAMRATDPEVMKAAGPAAIGRYNDAALMRLARNVPMRVAAWGNHGSHLERAQRVLNLVSPVYALRVTKSGHPAHPLRLPADLVLTPYA